jgi:hypothetical protein
MRADWSDDSSRIPDPSPDCGFAAPPRKVQHRCLPTDVVAEALREEPGLQPSLGPSPGGTGKFVFHIIKGHGFQNLSFFIVLIIIID